MIERPLAIQIGNDLTLVINQIVGWSSQLKVKVVGEYYMKIYTQGDHKIELDFGQNKEEATREYETIIRVLESIFDVAARIDVTKGKSV